MLRRVKLCRGKVEKIDKEENTEKKEEVLIGKN